MKRKILIVITILLLLISVYVVFFMPLNYCRAGPVRLGEEKPHNVISDFRVKLGLHNAEYVNVCK